jgi:hypothetical protein
MVMLSTADTRMPEESHDLFYGASVLLASIRQLLRNLPTL